MYYEWSRELGEDFVAKETAYTPKGYTFIVVRSRDRELIKHGYKRCTSFYDFTGTEQIVVIIIKGPKEKSPCLVTDTELTYHTAILDLGARNSSTAATNLKPLKSLDASIPPLDLHGERELFKHNPGIRAVCRGRSVVDTRHGVGRATGDNSRVIKVFLMDIVVNIVQLREDPAKRSTWRSNGFFDL